MMRTWLLSLLFFAPMTLANPLVWQADNGDMLQLTQLDSGEYWASLTLTDSHTANFADNELIFLQLDTLQPVSLVHGLRSCGSPARAPQQIDYQFNQQEDDWLLAARRPPSPLPEGFVIKDSSYPTIHDRRTFIVDFPLQTDGAPLWPQWQSAKIITIRYSLDNGTPVTALFDLSQQHRGVMP
ncbi:MAG: hypothetical protein RQ732_04470 [Methylophaga sp.]|nr:hypothetical protein [Methylophaga sp.]